MAAWKKENKKCSPDNLCSLISYYKSLTDVKCDISAVCRNNYNDSFALNENCDTIYPSLFQTMLNKKFIFFCLYNKRQWGPMLFEHQCSSKYIIMFNRFGITLKLVNNKIIFLSGWTILLRGRNKK